MFQKKLFIEKLCNLNLPKITYLKAKAFSWTLFRTRSLIEPNTSEIVPSFKWILERTWVLTINFTSKIRQLLK